MQFAATNIQPQILLDECYSSRDGYCFKKSFTGQEFYLRDHKVKDILTLPAVVYLEMVRAAATLITGNKQIIKISNVIWMQPLQVLTEPVEVILNIYTNQKAGFNFEVSTSTKRLIKPTLYAKGKFFLSDNATQVSCININNIKASCKSTQPRKQIYSSFDVLGLEYGPTFQVIEEFFYNQNEVIAFLKLPSQLTTTEKQFALHPAILDGAIQSIFALLNANGNHQLYLPFNLGQIEIINDLTPCSVIYGIQDPSMQMSNSTKFQIQVANQNGTVLTYLKNFSARILQQEPEKP